MTSKVSLKLNGNTFISVEVCTHNSIGITNILVFGNNITYNMTVSDPLISDHLNL